MALIQGKGSGTAWGTSGNDIIHVYGAAGGYGQGGNDQIRGDDAANKLVGGTGDDVLDGAGGADFLDGGAGNDKLLGGAGNDILYGGDGNDFLHDGAGIDRLSAGAGNDSVALAQEPGDFSPFGLREDSVDGGAGHDTLHLAARGATVAGAAAERFFLHWDDLGLQVDYSAWTGDAGLASARGFEAVSMAPLGLPLSYSGSGSRQYEGSAVRVSGTDGADAFSGGLHDETAVLGAGADAFYVSGGRDSVSLGSGRDTVFLNGNFTTDEDANPVPVDTVVRDFNPAEDRVDASLWGRGALSVSDRADGTHVEGPDASVVFLNVHDWDPFIA